VHRHQPEAKFIFLFLIRLDPFFQLDPLVAWSNGLERCALSRAAVEAGRIIPTLVTSKFLNYVGDALAGVPVPQRRDAATFAPACQDG